MFKKIKMVSLIEWDRNLFCWNYRHDSICPDWSCKSVFNVFYLSLRVEILKFWSSDNKWQHWQEIFQRVQFDSNFFIVTWGSQSFIWVRKSEFICLFSRSSLQKVEKFQLLGVSNFLSCRIALKYGPLQCYQKLKKLLLSQLFRDFGLQTRWFLLRSALN